MTVLFILIIAFNIKFTAGNVNGFIFYSQVVSSLSISSHGISRISLSNPLNVLTDIHLFIHRSFNMEFFVVNSLSFCLWEGATTLDIVAFSYITILYAFLLVILTVLIMKYFSCCLRWCHRRNTTSYAIHGLSTFLILCYVRCTQVSFKILTSSRLVGANLKYMNRRRVFYGGNHQYFDKHHVIYAIPALVCIIIVVTTPPALLIWYPAGPNLLQKCGIGDSKVSKLLSKLIPLHKLQPLFDSFQSCYHDNRRFFSGLYFLYRTSIVAAFAGVTGIQQYYFSIQILLAAMLALHAIAQPYKSKWHNIIDASILAILSIINAVSGFIVSQQVHLNAITKMSILDASRFQLVLIYLPLISFLTYGILKTITIIKAKCGSDINETKELTDFPARLIYSDDESSDESDKGYKPPYVQGE